MTLSTAPSVAPPGNQPSGARKPALSTAQTRIVQTTRRVLIVRSIIIAFAAAMVLIGPFGPEAVHGHGAATAVLILALFSNAIILIVRTWPRLARGVLVATIGLDLFLVTVLVFYTGGVQSHFIVFYFGPILAASLALPMRSSLLAASSALILLSLVSIFHEVESAYTVAVPEFPSGPELRRSIAWYMSQGLAFFLVSLLSSRLASHLGEERILSEEILDNIGQGLLVVGAKGHIQYANKELRPLLRIHPADLPGELLEDVLAGDDLAELREAISRGVGTDVEIQLRQPDGSHQPVRVRTVGVPRSGPLAVQSQLGMIVILTDLHLQKRVEEAMRQAERSEAVSSMATAIAHELRNPLASMRGAIQEVRESEDLRESSTTLMDIVLSESDRLDNIISNFLQFARMPPVYKHPCRIEPLISETVVMCRTREEAEGVQFESDVEEGLRASVDADQLRQVLINLSLNALRAVRERPDPSISIAARACSLHLFTSETTRRLEDDIDGFSLSVADNGCGMDSQTRLRAFDPFFTTNADGTGLGLALVSRIIRGHNGHIAIHSHSNSGTTVRIWLPST